MTRWIDIVTILDVALLNLSAVFSISYTASFHPSLLRGNGTYFTVSYDTDQTKYGQLTSIIYCAYKNQINTNHWI